MHPQFSYGAGNTYTNDIQATATPSIIPPIPNQMDSPRASSSSISSPHSSTTTIPSSLRSNTSVSHPPSGLSPNHLFLSPMSYQPHNHYQHQSLQQQPDLPQSDFPSYPMPLEQSAYPHQLSAAEPSNKDFLGHFNPVSFETISLAQDHSMASSFDSEEVPQGWLWDAYQRAAMDSMLLDRTRQEQEQQHCLPLVHTPGLSSSHSTALPSGLYAGDTFWHSNALELASRAAALASAPLMSIASAAPVFSTTTPAFLTNDIAESSSFYHTMESSSSSVTVPSSSSQSSISATPGLLRPSRSDGVGRKSRRSSSKTSSSLTSSRRSGRSRSLVSSPRSPFLSDPNETFDLSLSSTIPSYSPHSLQLYHNLHHCLAHNCQGGSNFSPSSSPSPSISPQASPISSFAHPSSRLSTAVAAKQDAGITAPTPPAPTFVRLPPSMFQCPMEKCPKSFARAYNLHIHLKTQHHLASKELAAVSPLRAPPSAPPFQIITPEEVAAGTTMSDKEQPSAVQSGSKATNTTTSLTQSNLLSTSADNTTNNNDGDNINNNINNNNHNNNNHNNNNHNNNNNNGGNGMISGCCDASNGEGGDNGSLDCDSSCASPTLGGTAAFGQGRSFACHLCPRIFSRKHDLHRHIRVHTGSKPYLCTNCHKAFARTDALCRHYKVEDDCRQVLMEVETASTVAVTESKERVAH